MRTIGLFLLTVISLNGFAQSKLFIANDGVLTANGVSITLHNTDIINEGVIKTKNSNLELIGDELIEFDGYGIYELHRLTLNIAERLRLEQDLLIEDQLTFKSGRLDLNNSIVFLGESSGELQGETDANFAFASGNGLIIKPFQFNSPANHDPGRLGIEISSFENLGSSQLIRAHKSISLDGTPSVERSYEIITEFKKNETASVRAHYRNNEQSITMTNPAIWSLGAQKSTSLRTLSFGRNGSKGNFVEANIINDFSIYTIGEAHYTDIISNTPTAFTPNGDNKNDVFVIPFLAQVDDAQVMIFNRWGEKIYESNQYSQQPWDGTWKGKVLDPNTFYYRIRIKEERKTIDGKISIVR